MQSDCWVLVPRMQARASSIASCTLNRLIGPKDVVPDRNQGLGAGRTSAHAHGVCERGLNYSLLWWVVDVDVDSEVYHIRMSNWGANSLISLEPSFIRWNQSGAPRKLVFPIVSSIKLLLGPLASHTSLSRFMSGVGLLLVRRF